MTPPLPTPIPISDQNQIQLINEELEEVNNWFKANKLSVNATKTNYMILGTPHMVNNVKSNIDIILDNTALERVKHTKFLGVLIDECLTWKQHTDCVSKTIARNIGVISKLKHFMPNRILHTLYCTLLSPYLTYGVLVWGNTCKSYLDKPIKLQKWTIRAISNSHYRSHTAPIFAKYNILNITDMYTMELGTFMYKYHEYNLPSSFDNFFIKRSDIHNYSTRHKNNLQITNNKKVFSDQSVRTTGPHLWNSIDSSFKSLVSVKQFRTKLKQKLISAYNTN